MTWFADLTGFEADDPVTVRDNIAVDGTTLTSRKTGRVLQAGTLTTPALGALRQAIPSVAKSQLREVVADVQQLHQDPAHAGAFFQVASQFNLLEMVSPDVAPEDGIARYAHDFTQGPACAIACGAGTLWRNYFHPVGQDRTGRGQNSWYQLDMLADVGALLGNENEALWTMCNGYALPQPAGLAKIASRIADMDRDALKAALRIGLQTDTQVTLGGCEHRVTQAFCSALPVAYSGQSADQWEALGRLVLEASYEATFYAALQNASRTGNRSVFLTLLGGGAFGNPLDWITDAIQTSFAPFRDAGLDISIVSFGSPNPGLGSVLNEQRL